MTASQIKKRITVVVPYFYPKIGGVENYAYHSARLLHESGEYVVSVITTNPDSKKYREENLHGMRVHRLPIWFKISNTPINPLWYFQMKRIFKLEKTQIIHAHAPVPFFADIASLAKGNIPFVLTYHSGSMLKGKWAVDLLISAYERVFLFALFKRADAIVPVSQNFLENKRWKLFSGKTHLIRPGIHTSEYHPTPLPTGESQVVTFVGRIEHTSSWKGIEELLQAMVVVARERPRAKLEIVGGGDAVEHYRMRAKELNIDEVVSLPGPKFEQDLKDAYARSTVVVLPSTSEAEQSSVVLIEAMASGRPVIGTRIGGTRHIVHDEENGLLVEPKNPVALAGAIKRILSDRPLAEHLAVGAVASAKEVDWAVQIKKYETIFQSLLHS